METLSREEKIQQGLKAAALLDNADLMSFFTDELERIKVCMVNTRPDEGKERNLLYYQHYALNELVASLTAYKEAAITEIEALEAENNQKEVN